MAFVVDSAEWCFDDWPNAEVERAIDMLLERVSTARNRNETVWIGSNLQTRPVLGDHDLWNLRSPTAPVVLRTEIWQELAAWLGTAPFYLDEEWPDGMTDTLIQIDRDPAEENEDLAWAHHHVRAGRAIGCLSLRRSGPHETASSLGNATVHWVRDEATHRAFWRAALDVEGDDEATLERLAPHAFPDLHFHDGVWNGLARLSGGYRAVRSQVRRYLAVLDDHGRWAFTYPPPTLRPGEAAGSDPEGLPPNQIIEKRFRGYGLDMAPENPVVYTDSRCRRAREITIGNRTLYCEWHGKLEPHRNRLHVHSPVSESCEKVIIAVFHEHLPLPG